MFLDKIKVIFILEGICNCSKKIVGAVYKRKVVAILTIFVVKAHKQINHNIALQDYGMTVNA